MDNRDLFEAWAREVSGRFIKKQWLLSKWENIEGVEWPEEKIRLMMAHVAGGLSLQRDHLLVDLGCGGGWFMQSLAPLCRRTVGVDFSFQMLLQARMLDTGGSFVSADILRLPFRGETADRILCYFVLLNFMDDHKIETAFREIWRVLKSGGRAVVGQLPDAQGSPEYDRAKAEYLAYAGQHFKMGQSHREEWRFPQKLFDKSALAEMLRRNHIRAQFRESFNPFYRPGAAQTVSWRFDVILSKD